MKLTMTIRFILATAEAKGLFLTGTEARRFASNRAGRLLRGRCRKEVSDAVRNPNRLKDECWGYT
jgi:hypothetical protein